MEEWTRISLLLCVFGFLKEIRPSEPFVTDFLAGSWRNITQEEINREIYPVGTYSYAVLLILVFLVTDFLRYKPVILVNGFSGIIVWCLLLWTTSLEALQTVEFFYGTYLAAEVAYFTYIYAKVDKEHYPKVTSHTRAALLCGKLVAGIIGQILIFFKVMDYRDLNYITLAAQIMATLWAFLLPNVKSSLYFHRQTKILSKDEVAIPEESSNITSAFILLWTHFMNAYTNRKVLQWSILYAVGMCGYLQVVSYIQIVWSILNVNNDLLWNGAVDAAFTFFGALVALLAGYVHAGRMRPLRSLLIIAVLSVFEGLAILLASWTHSLYVSYFGYIIFGILYSFTITVASAEVARYLEEDSFGLVFGINTFIAILLQVVLTFIVVEHHGFALDIEGQFTVYSFYFISLGIIYSLIVLVEYFLEKRNASESFSSSIVLHQA